MSQFALHAVCQSCSHPPIIDHRTVDELMIKAMSEDSTMPELEQLLEVVETSPPEVKKRFHAAIKGNKSFDRSQEIPDVVIT